MAARVCAAVLWCDPSRADFVSVRFSLDRLHIRLSSLRHMQKTCLEAVRVDGGTIPALHHHERGGFLTFANPRLHFRCRPAVASSVIVGSCRYGGLL